MDTSHPYGQLSRNGVITPHCPIDPGHTFRDLADRISEPATEKYGSGGYSSSCPASIDTLLKAQQRLAKAEQDLNMAQEDALKWLLTGIEGPAMARHISLRVLQRNPEVAALFSLGAGLQTQEYPAAHTDVRTVNASLTGGVVHAAPILAAPEPVQGGSGDGQWTETSILLMNIPKDFQRNQLIVEMEGAGYKNSFDFIYIPRDFVNNVNRGYAIINFREAWYAEHFFKNFKIEGVEVLRAKTQGLEENIVEFLRKGWRIKNANNVPMIFTDEEPQGVALVGKVSRDVAELLGLHV